jgi:hypothetical protein
MKIVFDFEGRMEDLAFYALYAGLRMFKDLKETEIEWQIKFGQTRSDAFSLPAAEAYCMLMDMKKKYPKWFKEAEKEYNEVYKSSKK